MSYTSLLSLIFGLILCFFMSLFGIAPDSSYMTVATTTDGTAVSASTEDASVWSLDVYYDIAEIWGDPFYAIVTTDDGVTLTVATEGDVIPKKTYTLSEDEAVQLFSLIDQYDFRSWDGFNETDQDVLDGYSFGMLVRYDDGTTVYAHGNNSAPEGWHQFYDSFYELVAPYAEDFMPAE